MTDLRRNRYSISAGVGKSTYDSFGRFLSSPRRPFPSKFNSENERSGFDFPWTPYSLDWLKQSNDTRQWIAVGSLIEEPANKIQILQVSNSEGDKPAVKKSLSTANDLEYPVTKVMWNPPSLNSNNSTNLLASTDQKLRLWNAPTESGNTASLSCQAALSTHGKTHSSAPLTSFDWCKVDPSLIIVSSLDTTCTVWDVVAQQSKTQLIAHDREVFDVAFTKDNAHVFVSVGADGSVRMFDLRSLDHSTIIYEGDSSYWKRTGDTNSAVSTCRPLLRLATCDADANLMATFHHKSSDIKMIDIRVPGTAYSTLSSPRGGDVNAVSWMPNSRSKLASCGDDCMVHLWDLSRPLSSTPTPARRGSNPVTPSGSAIPISEYATPMSTAQSTGSSSENRYSPIASWKLENEVNNIAWSGKQDSIAALYGKSLELLAL
ncbi:WDR68 family WD repeat protein [Schizosaccharomyces cryophilus OY26]|uniref:WDR68 family WD repeat protein n=1 Tax=Schizosaccharomyces cryophilus (strain OY26 / ATCC MYA-4695 / CBS 11777 / NBRC 106824 / NRRL Y48691) TaxID=653667 RepID=S9X0Y2_SCHCR|nr:WDR68 family WD repeat protein [Schizosaccharomyces cryophilus OY26]EPY50667.1 WDR68 family WD repeat protein [Schizosaccharomyces cryophilus OY26]